MRKAWSTWVHVGKEFFRLSLFPRPSVSLSSCIILSIEIETAYIGAKAARKGKEKEIERERKKGN